MEPTLVRLTEYAKYINIRTITRLHPSATFTVNRRDLLRLQARREVIAQDGNRFAVLRHDNGTDALRISLYWLNTYGEQLRGRVQDIELPYGAVMAYVKAEPSGQVLRFLSTGRSASYPKLEFCGKRLHEVVSNKLVRRKFSKFLRNHFNWPGATEILLYDDFVPYSFYFKEMCGEVEGIRGGVILHGQEDMRTACYSIHT